MGDSEEEHDLKRRDRNKFKRERENLGNEEEFDNKRRNLAQPDFDSKWKTKREYSPTNRSLKRNKRDPRDSRSFTIPWHPWDVNIQDYCVPSNPSKISSIDDSGKFIVLTFKQFMMNQDDMIDEVESVKRYSDYKQSINASLISSFFDKHKNEEWFQERYHPVIKLKFNQGMRSTFLQRLVSFWFLYTKGLFDSISLDIQNRSQIENILKKSVIFMEKGSLELSADSDIPDYVTNMLTLPLVEESHQNPDTTSLLHSEDGEVTEESDCAILAVPKHKDNTQKLDSHTKSEINISSAISAKGFPLSIKRQDIEDCCKPFDKLIRLFLTDPIDTSNSRNAWLAFTSNIDLNSVISHLESHFNKGNLGCDLSFSVVESKDPYVKAIDGCENALDVIISNLTQAIKLVREFDEKNTIFTVDFNIHDILKQMSVNIDHDIFSITDKNPLLQNTPSETEISDIRNKLAAAEKAEEEEEGVIPSEVCYRRDEHLLSILDALILYLRIVYSYDFYSFTQFPCEDLMPCRISSLTIRGVINNSANIQAVNKLISDHISCVDRMHVPLLLTESEMAQLGKRNEDDSIGSFINENTKMLDPEKYLCPLSGKKFKGPEYVKKHIFNKHNERIEEVKLEVQYFNNYLKDKNRPITQLKLPQRPDYSNLSQNQTEISDEKLSFNLNQNIKSKDATLQPQNWPFHPNFIVPPHAPPMPPPFDYNRFPSFGNIGTKRNIAKKFDDTRKPISYKDWDDPNLDN